MEKDFFITEYMSCGRNELKCTIKRLYSDFIVNEITPDGTILDIPLPCTTETIVENEEVKNSWTDINDISSPETITQELVSKIDALLKDEINFVEIPTEDMDKQKRTLIHEWIRNRYNGLLDSETVGRAIRILVPCKRTRKRRTWPADRPDFVHFTLCKENKDTHYALSVISKFLGMKISSFGICGTKDRRALTTQRVSLYRCEIERLQQLNAKLHGIMLTDFTFNSEPCKLGNLWGNRFKIILRDVHPFSEDDLIDRIEDFKSNGFINYFGTQRFGSCASNTAEIGIAILKKQWEVALKAILKPRNAHRGIREALDEWNKSGNASSALKKLTDSQACITIEGQLLSSLSKNKCNYHAALLKLARNTRSLYVHAYQSLLWNKVVTRRVKNKGFRAIAGDLNVQGQEIKEFENDEVALPLISGSVKFPDNEVRDWYEEIMAEDGVTIAMEYAIGAVMRPLITKPQDVKYKILTYPEADTKLQADLKGNIASESIGTGDLHAVALEFSLPSGSYATIALREITRFQIVSAETEILNMRLSVKSADGKIEVFNGVQNWSFSALRRHVAERFNLKRDFALFFGSHQLPTDDTKLSESDMEFVNGDRLRLVVNEKELFPTDYASGSSCPEISAGTGSNNSNSSVKSETVFEIVLHEMKQRGFERINYKDGDMRWTFHHPDSVLVIEIDFRVYNDRWVKYVHATASIYHPSGRQFLEPVVLEEESNDLQKKIFESLISPLKLALFGHENPFLRLLGGSAVAECLFEMLDAKSILRLERTNKHAFKLCRSQRMERIWKLYCERDFGKDACALKKESYREAYKRLYIRHVRELNYLRNLLEPDIHSDVPIRISFPTPTHRPENPDPDIPEGPFQPPARNPYMPSSNPFPFPGPGNPFDPFHGRELLPSRPIRPSGIPRVFPRGRSTDQGNMYQ